MPERFGSRLQELRKQRGFTQAQLAQQMNKADSTIRMWELGKNQPDHDSLIRLAQIFAVSVDYLLGQSDVKSGAAKTVCRTKRPEINALLELVEGASDEELAAVLRIVRGFLKK